ncbi:MAG TPA: hypothetical protein PLE48_17925 [Thiobacillus sp.]|nr:hypothetical protein [Thiobacillus sp.]
MSGPFSGSHVGGFIALAPETQYFLVVLADPTAVTALLLDINKNVMGVASVTYTTTGYHAGVVLGRSPSNVTCMSGYVVQLFSEVEPVDYFNSGSYGKWMDPPSPATGLTGAITSGTRPVCSGDHGVGLLNDGQKMDFSVEIPWKSTGECV